MKNLLLATATFVALTSAHHRCDNIDTAETNANAGPLAKAYQKASSDKDQAFEFLESLKKEFGTDNDDVTTAQSAMESAQLALARSQANISSYHTEYNRLSQLVANCKPDDAGSDCTLDQKNLYSLQMVEAGNTMIDNDNQNQKNIKILEQKTYEHSQAKSEQQFNSAGSNTKLIRAQEDLDIATKTYQNLKDQYEKHKVTGEEEQKDCQLDQYENDMAEIEKLEALLLKCKTEGCQIGDLDGISGGSMSNVSGGQLYTDSNGNIVDANGNPSISDVQNQILGQKPQEKKYHENGKIRFPNCGNVASSECFWLHYQASGWLDFLSFFMYIPALIGCAIYSDYEYGLCLGNFAYIFVDATSKKLAPYLVAFD